MENEDVDIKSELERGLGPEYISFKNTGYSEEPYIEGWASVQMANRIFGYSGWSSQILSIEPISIEEMPEGKVTVTAKAHVKIILKDGTFREDIGFGLAERIKGIGKAKKNAYKSAVTDAIKRSLKQFGRALGSCCNDKNYIKHIKRVRKIEVGIDDSSLIRPNSKPRTIPRERMAAREENARVKKQNIGISCIEAESAKNNRSTVESKVATTKNKESEHAQPLRKNSEGFNNHPQDIEQNLSFDQNLQAIDDISTE
ncbi:DNA repair and recombination protein RAD52 [Nematocida minor]|uniref:DNA repair and recombination protein RAD52 n=1 Tax=Nematocida minor TaxID=1912983 RepID=UPI00221E3C32|nr:DNA repair and recombination protein RAD52 [Nematocida minor]KAI5190957.1 DNA repair and recombination protein RAD52 [Nematocida minor]